MQYDINVIRTLIYKQFFLCFRAHMMLHLCVLKKVGAYVHF